MRVTRDEAHAVGFLREWLGPRRPLVEVSEVAVFLRHIQRSEWSGVSNVDFYSGHLYLLDGYPRNPKTRTSSDAALGFCPSNDRGSLREAGLELLTVHENSPLSIAEDARFCS